MNAVGRPNKIPLQLLETPNVNRCHASWQQDLVTKRSIMKYLWIVLYFVIGCCQAQQSPLIGGIQYGATLKAKLELRYYRKQEPKLNFRVAAAGGVAGQWMIDELYPSLNCELQLYNGGLGSDSRPGNRKSILDAVVSVTLTTGRPNIEFRGDRQLVRYVPLRYFSDFAACPLQNPYNYSFSLGTNFVFTWDANKCAQQVGFLDVMFAEGAQISYYNDGTPFNKIRTGDYRDRYYTGGAMLSYTRARGSFSRFDAYQFELSYQKFSGYTQDAFELSNALNTSNTDYKDVDQSYYNKSLWKFNVQLVGDDDMGKGMAISWYNSIRYDAQHWIHWKINNAYHIVPYKGNLTIEPSIFMQTNHFKTK